MNFRGERICIDKVFLVFYDEEYSKLEHRFDSKVRDQWVSHIKRSAVKAGRFEEVIRFEGKEGVSWAEFHLKGARIMFVHLNVIRYLQNLKSEKPCGTEVIHDDNFLPQNSTLKVKDFTDAIESVVRYYTEFYQKMMKKIWGVDLDKIKHSYSQIEIPFEVWPANVSRIYERLLSAGRTNIHKFATQSDTIYFDEAIGARTVKLKGVKTRLVDGDYNTWVYLNAINVGEIESKIQVKIYQKAIWGLCRIEFTISSGKELKRILESDNKEDKPHEILIQWVHYQLRKNFAGEIQPYESYDEIIKSLSNLLKIHPSILDRMRTADFFESSADNNALRKALLRKGVIHKITDDHGSHQRGIYAFDYALRSFVRSKEKKDDENYGLVPMLENF